MSSILYRSRTFPRAIRGKAPCRSVWVSASAIVSEEVKLYAFSSRNKFKEMNLFWRGQDDGYRGGAVAASDLRLHGAFLLFLVLDSR